MATSPRYLLLLTSFIFLFTSSNLVSAQEVIEIPDCNIFPEHFFCIPPPPDIRPDPIVFVPGLVASYNRRVLFKDKTGGTWTFVPFGNIYAGLLARIQSVGYVKDQDLFIAYYDWRQSNAESASEYLAPIIAEAKTHSESGKVDIVAHSMGGLLAQEYIKSDQYTLGEIDDFIMLGTPNSGSGDAYLPWEGGILPSRWGVVMKAYVEQIEKSLKKTRSFNQGAPLTYRAFFPSLKELLPADSYIVKNGESVDPEDLTEKNPFLEAIHAYRDTLLTSNGISVTTIAGTGKDTLSTIAIGNTRTEEDVALGRWRDGHPNEENPSANSTAGDQTVLSSSALFGPSPTTLPGVSHTALPEQAQDEVLNALGVLDEGPKKFIYQEPKQLTGFVVLSPIDIVITDATGKTVSKDTNDFGDDAFVDVAPGEDGDDPKIIIFQNLPKGTYTVHLTGTATGPYTVITTHTDDTTSSSETITGDTTLGKKETFMVNIGDSEISISPITQVEPIRSASVGGGKGDEKDCCPGKDITAKPKPKGKVLGATTKKIKAKKGPVTLEELKPLNDIFYSVYGRIPTLDEWKYWTKRYSTDKRDWEKIRGAMGWRFARGL